MGKKLYNSTRLWRGCVLSGRRTKILRIVLRGAVLLSILLFHAPSGALPQLTVEEDIPPRVLNGIDVLVDLKFAPLAGKRVGLITNHTGLAADGRTTIDLLHSSGVSKLVSLFSPEHGIRGVMDSKVPSSIDDTTGLPIHSLYGETKRPTAEMLRGIDALVFDIQDIGARFYTYPTTLAYCMEEAAKAKVAVYVLDRPNPMGGLIIEGPMLDPDKTSFIGYIPMPIRHGMTVGELAQYFKRQNKIDVELHVIPMKGWRRSYSLDYTGQIWVNPSPNMRSLLQAFFYPGVCLLEATNVSVGRGTDRPFEVIGAPWIEPRRLASALNGARVPGVRFVPIYFTPASSTHRNARCGGVNLMLTNRAVFNSVLTGMTLVSTLNKLYPGKFEVDKVLRLLGNSRALEELKKGRAPSAVLKSAEPQMRSFLRRRNQALVYKIVPRAKKSAD